ncbi:MAG: hypothetical protein JWM89_1266 [Acidimicrobiales bacterium]|nr:hypothetical protein [Acidimicrobiales bacterium]
MLNSQALLQEAPPLFVDIRRSTSPGTEGTLRQLPPPTISAPLPSPAGAS